MGAALALWAEAHAAKVQTTMNANIEQYHALQGGNQV